MDRITSIGDFYSYAADFQFVSFDLFDTILKRRFLRASEVHDTVSVYTHKLIRQRTSYPAAELTALRWASGSALKARTDIEMQEPTAAMVWDRLLSFEHGLTDADRREALAKQIVDFEHELELRNLALVDGALDLLQRLKAENKTLIAISDMYFGSEIIEGILAKLGVLHLFDHVYVSAEVNLTKHSGDLFKRVLRDLAIQPHQMRHVGDNHHSDVAMATQVGIPCVLVDQEQLLQLERPDYGNRERVEEDIADVIKAHLFSVLLDAQELEASHLYFMGRDGCTISDFLTNWQSRLIGRFLPPPNYTDIFLNRVLTMWANVDFGDPNWLEQAIGLAFWLKEGTALPGDLAALLGTSSVPATLGNRLLVSSHDTTEAVRAFRDAGLEPEIKARIRENCQKVERYLEGVGFFDHKTVMVSDVGYSGSVLRALNRLLLNRSPEAYARHVPPLAKLHLIATYKNYEVNRIHAGPTVRFADRVVIPYKSLPKHLGETFAWIEYFFKHPTLRPVLELVERDGKTVPLLEEDEPPAQPIPSQRLQQFAIDKDEDIALLWMAAVGDFAPLNKGILERFDKPDPATIAQMRDEIFELDSVKGTRRSVVLEVEGGDPKTIAKAAIAGDYWVSGSLAASAVAGASLTYSEEVKASSPLLRKARWKKRFAWAIKKKAHEVRGFDPTFYRNFYPDLRQFKTSDELLGHFMRHGRSEGRITSLAALRAHLRAEFGIIPDDFSPEIYLHYNPELADKFDTPERLLDHYMRIGRVEGRQYAPFLELLIEEFEELRGRGALALAASERKRLAAGESTFALFLARHGLEPGPWLDQLEVAEFRAMHGAWCGPVLTTAECVVALCEAGLDKAPALSLEHQFDPEFYRAQIGADDDRPLEDLYRHYLNVGSRHAAAPSEMTALLRIWGHGEYPACFDWRRYRSSTTLGNASRSEVLKAFAADLDCDHLSFIAAEDSAQFLTWLAVHTAAKHDNFDEARRLFKAARERGAAPGLVDHLSGEMERAAGQFGAAIDHYRESTKATPANRWSFTEAAALLLDKGDYRTALAVLETGRGLWQEMVPWRQVHERVLYDWSLAYVDGRAQGSGSLAEPDALVQEIARGLPAPVSLTPANGRVLVVTGRPNAEWLRRHVAQPEITVLDLHSLERGNHLGAILQHGTVIFHELPFTFHVLQAILVTQSLGKHAVAWFGDLVRWGGWALDECAWDKDGRSLSELTRENLHLRYDLVARYCRIAVSTIPGCAESLRDISPDTEWHDVSRLTPGLRRVPDGNKVALVLMPDSEVRLDNVDRRAGELLRCVRDDPRLHLLVGPQLAGSRLFRDMAGRWTVMEPEPSLPDLASMVATCDLLVEFVGDARTAAFSLHESAKRCGIPTISLPLSPDQAPAGDLKEAVKHALEAPSSPAGLTLGSASPLSILPPAKPRSGRKRLLLVNAWAPPQVIGGASRVLKDNLDYFLDHHGDEFEIALFAGDDHREGHGNYSVDTYRGLPIFRLALPPKENVFWQPESAVAAASFGAVLESFAPDLVHIHCLQRLSGSIAQSCRSRGVPYIVTLHDAWWLSDFPFLANADGLAAPAFADYSRQQRRHSHGITASTLRAERLRQLLLGARRRLAVSRSFAELYGSVGIPCEVVENGNSKIEVRPRVPNTGPVQICHLGGRERHKGAYLVEAALRKNGFDNLEFTMIDLTRDRSAVWRSTWGTTPVNVIGKLDTDDLSELYARMNVLVAPSTCHESFGLVVHEALAHGLWVVTSDRGALSEPIEQGVNGFVVDVADAEDLGRVLSTINSDPARYRTPTASARNDRDVDDQSRELVGIYRELLTAQ